MPVSLEGVTQSGLQSVPVDRFVISSFPESFQMLEKRPDVVNMVCHVAQEGNFDAWPGDLNGNVGIAITWAEFEESDRSYTIGLTVWNLHCKEQCRIYQLHGTNHANAGSYDYQLCQPHEHQRFNKDFLYERDLAVLTVCLKLGLLGEA